ncbi:proton-conducting transporter membrane subunit [Natrinema salsiterrestre]|uniref:Monovalent cation/H+ antiporter subunit D family protein n=1 Tax=Natrinema salsiterrestre TaxID=2950540 RepID=A0A9Q4L1S9_9EURY|nr:proton-conducting transporter membrane subunit [Natrinema salsiterrestre]MDF9746034.1 monovalent cation/H+ antiporter subunit D family protein [Natrinema salsiterrestre]
MSSVDLIIPLLIVAPILAATLPIALGLRFERTGWPVAGLTTLGLFGAAGYLASVVYTGGEENHTLGGYPPRYGIELVADEFSMLIVLLITAVATGVLAFTRRGGPRGNTFYTAYLLLVGGLLGISLTGDVFNLFVFLEITSIATYALVASGDGPEAAVASLKYLILGTVAASMYLIGVAFVFMATGTLNMVELATAIPAPETNPTLIRAGFAFITVGFAVKVAQWPLHTWQPSAYQQAPDGVTPLIAALVSTASAYAFGRLIVTVFEVDYLAATPNAAAIVLTIGCVSVLAGTVLAVIQTEVKRMLAYSSVSQFGLVIAAYGVVIAGSSETALIGAAIHLVGHGLLKAGLFLGVALVAASYGARTVDEYAGLAKERPFVAGSMAVLLFSLVGVPPGVGFVGKWYIALGAVESQLWPVAAVIFLSTMLTLAYAARLLEKMYFTPPAVVESPHATGAVATDGGDADDEESGDTDPTDDIGTTVPVTGTDTRTVSVGMVAIVVVAALGSIALGFAGGTFADLLEPFLTEVFN